MDTPDTLPLRQIFYISRSRADAMAVEHLLARARQQNQRRGITGALMFTGGHFAQLIEGPAQPLADTMALIKADARHDTVTRLIDDAITQRRFGDWSMALLQAPGADELIAQLLRTPQIPRPRAERLLDLMLQGRETLPPPDQASTSGARNS